MPGWHEQEGTIVATHRPALARNSWRQESRQFPGRAATAVLLATGSIAKSQATLHPHSNDRNPSLRIRLCFHPDRDNRNEELQYLLPPDTAPNGPRGDKKNAAPMQMAPPAERGLLDPVLHAAPYREPRRRR